MDNLKDRIKARIINCTRAERYAKYPNIHHNLECEVFEISIVASLITEMEFHLTREIENPGIHNNKTLTIKLIETGDMVKTEFDQETINELYDFALNRAIERFKARDEREKLEREIIEQNKKAKNKALLDLI